MILTKSRKEGTSGNRFHSLSNASLFQEIARSVSDKAKLHSTTHFLLEIMACTHLYQPLRTSRMLGNTCMCKHFRLALWVHLHSTKINYVAE